MEKTLQYIIIPIYSTNLYNWFVGNFSRRRTNRA